MKRYLILLLLDDVNDLWNDNDVARWVSQDDEDLIVAVKEIPQRRWKIVTKRIVKTRKNKGKEIWKVLGLK